MSGETSGNRLTPHGTEETPFRRSRSLRERTGIESRLEKLTVSQSLSLPGTQSSSSTENSRPVDKADFAEHVRIMSEDSDFQFSIEFEGVSNPRQYIATQAPLSSTVEAFWHMVWEQDCEIIVNLTKCVEKGKEKCTPYWPTNDKPLAVNNFKITVEDERHSKDWTVRTLALVDTTSPKAPYHSIQHLHFTGWPDFGVPEQPKSLVDFALNFRSRTVTAQKSTPVIHCSAGIGRTGAFIALDWLIQTIDNSDMIDIFGLVHKLRQCRITMVQTEQQYALIHHCALYLLQQEDQVHSNDTMEKQVIPQKMLNSRDGSRKTNGETSQVLIEICQDNCH